MTAIKKGDHVVIKKTKIKGIVKAVVMIIYVKVKRDDTGKDTFVFYWNLERIK